jgi:hypothetical protein
MALYFNTQRVHIVLGFIFVLLGLVNVFFAAKVLLLRKEKAPVYIECDPSYVEGVGRYVDALNKVREGLK